MFITFITFITVFCLGNVCNFPGNDLKRVTVNVNDISSLEDHSYYWKKDGKFTDNGSFVPNKEATKMNGCVIKLKTKNSMPLFTEFPCDSYILKLKG